MNVFGSGIATIFKNCDAYDALHSPCDDFFAFVIDLISFICVHVRMYPRCNWMTRRMKTCKGCERKCTYADFRWNQKVYWISRSSRFLFSFSFRSKFYFIILCFVFVFLFVCARLLVPVLIFVLLKIFWIVFHSIKYLYSCSRLQCRWSLYRY